VGYPTQQQKVDYLFKKLGFTKAKTGVAEDQTSGFSGDTKKAPPNEAISSPLIVPATSVWADTSYIPATPPNSSDGYVGVYKTTSAFQMTVDTTVSNNRSFIARDTWGNPASAIKGDWIDTQFGADYLIKVYKGDPSTGAATKILSAAGTSGKDDVWFFDYSSGILNFNGEDIDGQLSGITTSNIYIVGYRYLGTKGIQPPAGIGTFNNLYVSGVSTFVGNAYANSDVQVGGTLSVTGISTFSSNIDANGDLDVDGRAELDNVNIAETLNVVGVSTFAADIDANADVDIAANLAVAGVSTFTGNIDANGDLDVDGRSELDNVNIAETLNVVGISTFNDDVNLQGANAGVTSAYWDKSANEFKFIDNAKLSFGTDQDLELYHSSGNSYVKNTTAGSLLIQGDTIDLRPGSGDTGEVMLRAVRNAQVELRHDNSARFTTTGYGVSVYGGQAGIGTLGAPAIFHIDPGTVGDDTGTVIIKGNLQVDGTQTTVNSSTMDVADKNVGIASGAANDAAADGAGITVYSGEGNKTWNWVDATDAWTSSEHIQVASGKQLGFADDTNTYIDRPAVDRIRFTTGGSERLIVTNDGINVTGISTFSSNIDANGDLDVDGRAELDNVNIAETLNVVGVSTFNGNVGFATDITWGSSTYTSNTPLTFEQKNQVGVSTFLFKSGGSNQPEITFQNIHNGNWGTTFNTGTQHLKFIWEAPNEAGISTVDNGYLANRKIAALQEIATDTSGGNPKFQFRVNDGTSTLVRVWTAEHDTQIWRVDDTNKLKLTSDELKVSTGLIVTGISTFNDTLEISSNYPTIKLNDTNSENDYQIRNANGTFSIYDEDASANRFRVFSDGRVLVANQLEVGAGLTVTGISTFSSTVVSQKSVQIEENLNVTGITTFNGAITLPPGTGGNFGNINIAVTGNNEIDTDSGTGNLILDSAGGTINVDDGLTVAGVSTFTGASLFSNGATFQGAIIGSPGIDLRLGGNINSNSGITTLGVTTATNLTLQQLNVSGVSTFSGNVLVDADITTNNLNVRDNGTGNPTVLIATDDQNPSALRIKNDTYHSNTSTGLSIKQDNSGTFNITGKGNSEFVPLRIRSQDGSSTKELLQWDAAGNATFGYDLSVAGVSTFTGAIDANGDLDVDGRSELDNVNIAETLNVAGITTFNVDTGFIGGGAGITSAYWDQSAASFKFLDNVKAQFGDSQDLSIWHNGVNSFIEDSGTGALYIDTNHLYFRKYNTGDVLAMFQSDASVQLFHSGTKRLETTGTGVEISDDLNVAGVSTFVGETNIGTGGTVFTALVGAAASVGIGSATPDYMLDVAGAINSETDVKVQGVSISDTALNDAVAMAIALG